MDRQGGFSLTVSRSAAPVGDGDCAASGGEAVTFCLPTALMAPSSHCRCSKENRPDMPRSIQEILDRPDELADEVCLAACSGRQSTVPVEPASTTVSRK